jgi:hypothetical protein
MVLKLTRSTLRRTIGAAVIGLLQALIPSAPAAAQVGQYQPAGSLALVKKPAAERVKEAADSAPWRWGPIRLEPRLSLTNVGYDDNVFASVEGEERISDYHATLGAGIAAYSRLGSNVYFSTYLTPEYAWWKDRDDLRELSLSYGAGAFGFFNRIQLGLQAVSTDRQQYLSSEAEIPVQRLDERIVLDARVQVRPRLALIGTTATSKTRFGDSGSEGQPDLFVRQLDSDADRTEFVVAFSLRDNLEIGLGFEDGRTDFRFDPDGRSNDSSGPTLSVRMEGQRTRIDGHLTARTTDFVNPELGSFERTTGSLILDHSFGRKTGASLYLARRLEYGIRSTASTIDQDRQGISLRRAVGRRLEGRIFAERGTLEFRDPAGPNAGRIDDVNAVGGEVTMDLGRLTALRIHLSEVDFDSNLPEFDRSTVRFGVGVELAQGLLPW